MRVERLDSFCVEMLQHQTIPGSHKLVRDIIVAQSRGYEPNEERRHPRHDHRDDGSPARGAQAWGTVAVEESARSEQKRQVQEFYSPISHVSNECQYRSKHDYPRILDFLLFSYTEKFWGPSTPAVLRASRFAASPWNDALDADTPDSQ